MHDLQPVALLDPYFAECTARNDLQIALDRNLACIQAQLAKHVGKRDPDRHATQVAVDVNRDAFLELHRGSP